MQWPPVPLNKSDVRDSRLSIASGRLLETGVVGEKVIEFGKNESRPSFFGGINASNLKENRKNSGVTNISSGVTCINDVEKIDHQSNSAIEDNTDEKEDEYDLQQFKLRNIASTYLSYSKDEKEDEYDPQQFKLRNTASSFLIYSKEEKEDEDDPQQFK